MYNSIFKIMKDVYEYSENFREGLKKYINKRILVRAKFGGYSYENRATEFEKLLFDRTFLITTISVKGEIVCDHMWLHSKKFDKALGELEVGDIIEFYTIPKYYSKYKEKVYIKNSLVRVNLLNIGFEKIEDIIKI